MDSPAAKMMTTLEIAMIRAEWSFSGIELNAKIIMDPSLLPYKLEDIFQEP